jgi:hypothetical protein
MQPGVRLGGSLSVYRPYRPYRLQSRFERDFVLAKNNFLKYFLIEDDDL